MALGLFALLPGFVCAEERWDGDMKASFIQPPEEARPWTWWHWCDGYISGEGITKDLEAMKANGLAGAVIFNVQQTTPGPVKIFGPEWFDLLKHTAGEADRIGIKLSLMNCAGWSTAGGPWITPEQSMQQVSWSETVVHGPAQTEITLPRPFARMGYYRDTAVVAFPTPDGEERPAIEQGLKFLVDDKPLPGAVRLTDGDHDTMATFTGDLVLEFPQPFTAQSLFMANARHQWGYAEVFAETSTGTFTRVARCNMGYHTPFGGAVNSVSFPPVTASRFKVVFNLRRGGPTVRLGEIELGGYRISEWTGKALFSRHSGERKGHVEPPSGVAIDLSSIVDLTDRLAADGTISWEVPPGSWTILRMGATSTGVQNAPAAEEARGLEVDKMSREAVDLHVDATMGRMAQAVGGELFRRVFTHYFSDSYESGYQNWTPLMQGEFARRRGYEMIRWLPVMTGRVVGSLEESERFLWDVRRTVADLYADNFYSRFEERAAEFGIEASAEAYGGPFDFLQAGGRVSLPMAEFWCTTPTKGAKRVFAPVSSGHTYGRNVIAAEAFTGGDPWQMYPGSLKTLGDYMFVSGINRMVFHRYAHQPWVDERLQPGMALGPVGMNFERSNTWWDMSRAWMQYLSRCQYVLQSGLFVADMAYLMDEDPRWGEAQALTPPPGMDYDVVAPEVVMTRMQARDGRLVLPDGMSYRYLKLSSVPRMTPALAAKLLELVKAGATVIGDRPVSSPSLNDYPACDLKLKEVVDELWGTGSEPHGERSVGAGRIIWGRTLEQVAAADQVAPDWSCEEADALPKLRAIHRKIDDTDAYFMAWEGDEARAVVCTFRVSGKIPELWQPVTGAIHPAESWEAVDGRTRVRVPLDSRGSVFVVFRQPTRGPGPGMQEAGTDTKPTQVLSLEGPWTVRFLSGRGAPEQAAFEKLISWPEHSDPGIRYYSGTAEYETDFTVPATSSRISLDLGQVEVIAEVRINDEELGVLWTPPYRLDITPWIKPGRNTLTVRVANLWVNRMVGDEQFPLDYDCPRTIAKWPDWLSDPSKRPEPRRMTFSTFRPFTKDTPLLPSGLIGPVRIEAN